MVEQTPIGLEAIRDEGRQSLRVLLVTTWEQACGISEHSRMLKEAVEVADPRIELDPRSETLDPEMAPFLAYDLVHLNYQASLHSRWTPKVIEIVRKSRAVLVTYHDTGVPNADQCRSVIDAADAAVVHEPFDDLPADKTYYWRMGVPECHDPYEYRWPTQERPYLGTVGFPFPWKCYDELARVTEAAGWGLVLLAPNATEADYERWMSINPHVYANNNFLPQNEVLRLLRGCDATAFCYVTHNTGQSGAILQGIAARKPVIALSTCRQFRALRDDALGRVHIQWCATFEDVQRRLRIIPLERLDAGIVALAHQDRWSLLGQKYAALYRSLAEAR